MRTSLETFERLLRYGMCPSSRLEQQPCDACQRSLDAIADVRELVANASKAYEQGRAQGWRDARAQAFPSLHPDGARIQRAIEILSQLRALHLAATPAPWGHFDEGADGSVMLRNVPTGYDSEFLNGNDARLIVALRNLAGELLGGES